MPLRQLLFALAALVPALAAAATPGPVRRDHLTVELVAERSAIAPGGHLTLGLRLVHDPGWHTYWENAGDSGMATRVVFTLPDGLTASPIAWPLPKRLPVGPLVNYGYDGEVMLPVTLRAAPTLAAGNVTVVARVSWLVCEVECIPGDATLTLPLAIDAGGGEPVARHSAAFETARRAQPEAVNWPARLVALPRAIALHVEPDAVALDPARLELFPRQTQLIASAPGEIVRNGRELVITTPISDSFVALPERAGFVLVDTAAEPRRGWRFEAVAAAAPPTLAPAAEPPRLGATGLVAALLFAFAGGVLLNLMPCVFPVLALKAMGLVEHGAERARGRAHALWYLGGVLLSFAGLAAVLLALRAAGEQLGWGFQLQTPWVVAALAVVLVAMGLSLSGLYSIGGAWIGAGSALAGAGGARGAFFTGVLAVVVASPCTAPLMGPALGFAVTQPAASALAVFVALGAGLAAPVVLLGFVPALARLLPRPGPWMVRFKQLMAFPLYLTAIWLLWVLGRQVGSDGIAVALLGITALAFGLWLAGGGHGRWLARGALAGGLAAAVAALVWIGQPDVRATQASALTENAIWEPWSAHRLAELRAADRPVLVNMTAAWCITCLANERVSLSSRAFQQRLERLGIAYLKGDWTHRDASITAYLAEFGRNGVPLYVLYPRGGGEPTVLPQLLSPDLVLAALDTAAADRAEPPRVAINPR